MALKIRIKYNGPYSPSVGVLGGIMAAMRLFWQSRIREAQTRFLYCTWVQKKLHKIHTALPEKGTRPPLYHHSHARWIWSILALRSWNEVEGSIKHRVYGVRVLSLSSFFLLSFFFFISTFFRNGHGQTPPPPSPKRACPYFGKCGNLRTVPCFTSVIWCKFDSVSSVRSRLWTFNILL